MHINKPGFSITKICAHGHTGNIKLTHVVTNKNYAAFSIS